MENILKHKRDNTVDTMQKSLRNIRQVLGLSAANLGELIGVSRQSINNIEHFKNKMSFTQYISIAAIIDRKVTDKPEILPVIRQILKSNDYDYNDYFFEDEIGSDLNYSFLDEWFNLFPEIYDEIDFLLEECEIIDEDIFRVIAKNYKIFVDYDSIRDERLEKLMERFSEIFKEEECKLIIADIIIQKLKLSLESKNEEIAKEAERTLKFISMLHYDKLIDIRGDKTDDDIEDVLIKVFNMHKLSKRMLLITPNAELIERIEGINETDGYKIRCAQLTDNNELRFNNEENLMISNHEEIKEDLFGDLSSYTNSFETIGEDDILDEDDSVFIDSADCMEDFDPLGNEAEENDDFFEDSEDDYYDEDNDDFYDESDDDVEEKIDEIDNEFGYNDDNINENNYYDHEEEDENEELFHAPISNGWDKIW